MRFQTCRTKLWNIACYIFFALRSGIDETEGIRWINIPSQIKTCTGKTANLTWEYEEDANEEIRQFQWRFNTTTLIAYSSAKNGFTVDPKYQGRVEQIGVSGISVKNISSNDIGNYTLYPVISWKESPIIQSIWLNVIEATIQQWCTCERLPISSEWRGGRTFSIVTDGCRLEVNSSVCCIMGPDIECMEKDQHKLCVPINLNESTTESRTVPKCAITPDVHKENTTSRLVHSDLHVVNTIMISFLVACCVLYMLRIILKMMANATRKLRSMESTEHCVAEKALEGQDSYDQAMTQEGNILLEPL